ncbi:MAG: cytochrome d ubiquinol oxidase subunit II [Firmicutes bacterium]|nr:cytochrome d ubiquinol oxidase subunit II [Bacillota bacterium]
MDLNTIWFFLIGVLIIGYAVLDGFDLGVGSLFFLLARQEDEKTVLIKSIGPFWDGNEVWLLTGGGAIFAAFPLVYATVFSGFYLAMMLVLFALILRAVSIEFRTLAEDPGWRGRFDLLFFLGSFLPALLFGVAVGNIARGLPLDAAHHYTGGFLGLLNPYALLLGLLGLAAFLMQGITYTLLKTEGAVQERARSLFPKLWAALLAVLAAASLASWLTVPALFANYTARPVLYVFPLLTIAAAAVLPLTVRASRYGYSFLASSLVMAGMIATLGMGMYPNLVPAVNPALSLSIYNASSSPLTLKTMLIIALLGMPIVLFYTVFVYRVFRGKVDSGPAGY